MFQPSVFRVGFLSSCVAWFFSAAVGSAAAQPSAGIGARADTLTNVERVRIVEAAVGFRRMIFATDTTIRLDYCSVALILGPDFQSAMVRDVRLLISKARKPCDGAAPTYALHSLILRGIRGAAGDAMVTMSYYGGSYLHEEEFKIRKTSGRPDGIWTAREMRVYNALIAD